MPHQVSPHCITHLCINIFISCCGTCSGRSVATCSLARPVRAGIEATREGVVYLLIGKVCPPPVCEWRVGAHPSMFHTYIYLLRSCWESQQSQGPAEQWSEHHHQQRVVTMGNCCEILGNFFGRQKNTNVRVSLPAVCFVWQLAMIVLFGVFIRYDEESDAHWVEYKKENNVTSDIENDFYFRYPSKLEFTLQYKLYI